MKKTYMMEELDCANCAAKMEGAISKLEGVESVSVNFMTQKMVISAEEHLFPGILEQAQSIVQSIDRHTRILC